MYKYILEQERLLLSALENSNNLNSLYEYSKTQIAWISHERLIHLLVTFFIGLLIIVSFIGLVLLENILIGLLFIILIILMLFYIIHYCRLENGVQRLYKISNQIYQQINSC